MSYCFRNPKKGKKTGEKEPIQKTGSQLKGRYTRAWDLDSVKNPTCPDESLRGGKRGEKKRRRNSGGERTYEKEESYHVSAYGMTSKRASQSLLGRQKNRTCGSRPRSNGVRRQQGYSSVQNKDEYNAITKGGKKITKTGK